MIIREIIAFKLENKINLLRIHMISTGLSKGLNHPNTIKCSQELDDLLNKYQQIRKLKIIPFKKPIIQPILPVQYESKAI